MGAHDVPSGATATDYVESLLSEQLPAVVDQGIARSADVFCEPGWFTVEQSEDVLKASRTPTSTFACTWMSSSTAVAVI